MWDYDKLFADGNIIGIKNYYRDKVFNNVVDVTTSTSWLEAYKNDELCCKDQHVDIDEIIEHGYTTDFEIQYIIRLDKHGNVVEKLFDREKDIPKPMPELEDGMFGKIGTFDWDEYGNIEYLDIEDFIVTNNRVLFIQYGKINSWGMIKDLVDSTLDKDALCDEDKITPIEIYKNVKYLKNDMDTFEVIWRHPEYQSHLNSKSN